MDGGDSGVVGQGLGLVEEDKEKFGAIEERQMETERGLLLLSF